MQSSDSTVGNGSAKPRPTVDLGSVELVGQQLALYRALAEHSRELAGRYLGASVVLMAPANPEQFAQAAHSVRELMNNLHTISNVPVQAKGGRLGDKFAAMTERWESAKRNSDCFDEEGWHGEIDDAARRGFEAVDDAIAWQEKNRPKRKEQHRSTLRGLDAAQRPLPAFIENGFIELWDGMRDYFVDVCHHRRETTEEEFLGTLEQLERFVLDRLKPRTFAEQTTIDALIAEAESGG
jgi:hypothetical protein